MSRSSQRVAITGLGALTPLGVGVGAMQKGLEQGVLALQRLEGIPIPRRKDLYAPCDWPPSLDRSTAMAAAVVHEALEMAGPEADAGAVGAGAGVGLLLGTMWGETQAAESVYTELLRGERPSPEQLEVLCRYPTGSIVDQLAREVGLHGPRLVISNACASGNIVLGLGMGLVRSGTCRTVLAVGVDRFGLTGLWGAERSGLIGRSLRPFDSARDGTILGEGAACVVLERDTPSARARALAWLEGYHCVSEPAASSIELLGVSGLHQAMRGALADAGCRADDIDYVNAHAPGTRHLDRVECEAIAAVWPEGDRPLVNSTKALTGHLSGASALVELVATIVQMRSGFLHGHPALETVDPQLAVDVVGAAPERRRVRRALSNACGGGGINASVVVAAADVPRTRRAARDDSAAEPTRRIAITGVGVVTAPSRAEGIDDPHWFDLETSFPDAEDKGYDRINRAGQLSAISAARALARAGIAATDGRVPADRVAVLGGGWLGGWQILSTALCHGLQSRPVRIYPSTALDNGAHMGPLIICREYGFIGPWHTVCGFVDSGLQALSLAHHMLAAGRVDVAVVMGYDIDDPWLRRASEWLSDCTALRGFREGAATVVLEARDAVVDATAPAQAELLASTFTSGALDDDRQVAAAAERLCFGLGAHRIDTITVSAPADEGLQSLGRHLAERCGARLVPAGTTHSIAAEGLTLLAKLTTDATTLVVGGASASSQTAVLVASLSAS